MPAKFLRPNGSPIGVASVGPTLCLLTLLPAVALATEGGGSVYPYGLNTIATGVLPKPGHYLYVYNGYYEAKETMDDDGNALPIPFDVNVRSHTPRYLGVHPTAKLFGGSLGWQAALPLIIGDATVGRREDYGSAVGDAALGLMLGWHRPTFHQIAGIDLHVPVGSYDEDRLFNAGRNYWASTFYYSFTALPHKAWDINVRTNLTLNDENPATRYQSGHETGADYSVNWHPTPPAFLGVNGYFHYQLTDDEIRGEQVEPDGRRLRVFAYGPQIGYRGNGWGIVGKWQHEVAARNKAQGDKYWLQFFVRLGPRPPASASVAPTR
jgi:hypothetical protein